MHPAAGSFSEATPLLGGRLRRGGDLSLKRRIRLCRQQHKTYEEAAEILGISRSTVKKHMIRSMSLLKEAVESELGIPLTVLVDLWSNSSCASNERVVSLVPQVVPQYCYGCSIYKWSTEFLETNHSFIQNGFEK